MDQTDERLLELLRVNARESFVNLAKELNTSEGTVRARIKRLVDEGTIRRFTVRTSGANIKAIIEVSAQANVHTGDLTESIRAWKGVEAVYEVSGDEDLIIIVHANNTDELNGVIDKIRELPHVRSTKSRLILKEV
jgi:Lrp/AsnC family transcriptional regulator, regulator for asnA, asnC and gidA